MARRLILTLRKGGFFLYMEQNMSLPKRRGLGRFYTALPSEITLNGCALFGSTHKEYGWNPQPDPRWSDEQYNAYIIAYDMAIYGQAAELD